MRFDDTAQAYGFFHLVFADIGTHLSIATFRLRELREPGLTFNSVFSQPFAKTIGQFKDVLRQFDDCPTVSESLAELRESCTAISNLAEWRNNYIHARVRMSERGYALNNWRTGKRLELTRLQIETKIDGAFRAMAAFETHVPELVRLLKSDADFEEIFAKLPGLTA